ncbi:MAG: hypothetical protein FJX90_02430 [Bacteroidetes bacterium]|nr:hypothetical protein [Bacteroidota bacterium]
MKKTFTFLVLLSLVFASCRTKELATPIERQFPGTDEILRLSTEADPDLKGQDIYFNDFEIINAKQEGQWLVFETVYSGGCESHYFLANWDGRMMKSLPPQANIVVVHQHKSDLCRERITKKWAIDVRPFFERDESEVVVNLMSSDKNTIKIRLVAVE